MTIDEPGYFERLARVESGHWWSRSNWRVASSWLDRATRGWSGLAALDVGSGSGLALVRLAGLPAIGRVVGVEPDPTARRIASRHRGFRVAEGSALDLPFAAGSFDLVTCSDVFQHLPDAGDARAAAEIARVLRPGGLALVRANGAGFGPGRDRGGTAYRRRELVAILAGSGLEVVRSSYLNGLPALMQEARGRLGPGRWRAHPGGGGLRIDIPPRRINRLMAGVAGFERWATADLRRPLPFGHSTLALARKPGRVDDGEGHR